MFHRHFDESDPRHQGFRPSYKASHHDHGEHLWLVETLSGFYADNLVDDVLRSIKGGKEANVYLCRANPSTGVPFVAAKVYRPRKHRSLKNDAIYREGRGVLGEDGKTIKARDKRVGRAVQNMTRFGQELRIGSWIGHEYETLRRLSEAGIDVPRTFALGNGAILMEYLGDENGAAPTLQDVNLEPSEAKELFDRAIGNIERMLACDCIHADLSAYNVLHWQGRITIIDFPQAVDPRMNRHAEALLVRDVTRVCQYFGRSGVKADAAAIAADLWWRYQRGEL
jgi:RIO kinase 1